jgi:hypothetical protein
MMNSLETLIPEVLQTISTSRGADCEKTSLLVTAPHGSKSDNLIDDPCSGEVARKIQGVCIKEAILCRCFVSCRSRVEGDQNRFDGAFLMDDVAQKVVSLSNKNGGHLSKFLHVDVHSFLSSDKELPKGWGKGINILHLKGDEQQRAACEEFKKKIDPILKGVLPLSRVVEHPKLPRSIHSEESNAMIEISRFLGALSFLIELPTHQKGKDKFDLDCDMDFLSKAIVRALL